MKKSTRENLIQQIKNFGKPIFPKTVEQAIFDINDGTSLTDKLEDLQDLIDNIDGGGDGDGGPASWGNITGDIKSQEDLQNELDLKANVSDIPETYLEDVVAGTNVTIDKTDPYNPVISSSQEEVDPTVPSWAKLANKPSYTKAEVGLGNVDNTSDANKPISNATLLALNAKANTADLSDVATTGDYEDLINTPTIPALPAQFIESIVSGVGIEVDDVDPENPEVSLSSATQSSLSKADTAIQTETDPTVPAWAKAGTKPSYTKSEVGLSNVDNTSDLNKPISTATLSALDDKLDDPDGSDEEVIAGDGSLIGIFQLQAGAGISITESNGIVTISLSEP